MRQAQESEIIRVATKIRNQEPVHNFRGKEVQVLNKGELTGGMMLWADQILVGTNQTRLKINQQVRKLLNRTSEYPEENEKVICLQNYWDITSKGGNSLINGTIGYIKKVREKTYYIPRWISKEPKEITQVKALLTSCDNDYFYTVNMDKKLFVGTEKSIDNKTAYAIKCCQNLDWLVPLEFTYGYAITYWKAQGSEWDKVLILEENFPFDRLEHQRAMYTAVTRSSKKVVWIRK